MPLAYIVGLVASAVILIFIWRGSRKGLKRRHQTRAAKLERGVGDEAVTAVEDIASDILGTADQADGRKR